jgi:hypothetical protein
MVKVTGEVGSGKTMLCRVLMERLPDSVETIYLAVPSLSRDEMLAAIASDLQIDTAGANTTRLVRALQERLVAIHAAGKQVVALIDEAHAMPLATLEEIRLALEPGDQQGEAAADRALRPARARPAPGAAQHAPAEGAHHPRLHAWAAASARDRRIRPLPPARGGLPRPRPLRPEALRIIADASEGLTRRINIYADKTLLAAFAAGTHTVTPDHARAAVSDTQIVVAPAPVQARSPRGRGRARRRR